MGSDLAAEALQFLQRTCRWVYIWTVAVYKQQMSSRRTNKWGVYLWVVVAIEKKPLLWSPMHRVISHSPCLDLLGRILSAKVNTSPTGKDRFWV